MCGIFGIYSKTTTKLDILLKCLENLQHRGKDSFGIAYNNKYDNNKNHIFYKEKGLINCSQLNKNTKLLNTDIKIGIGHIKYTTSNIKNRQNINCLSNSDIEFESIQPLSKKINNNNITLAHNGNIPNTPYYDSQYILDFLCKDGDFKENLIRFVNKIEVSYNLVIIYNDILYIVKDRNGIRPMNIAFDSDNFYISSETVAYNCLNIKKKNIREISPGEIIEIKNNIVETIYKLPNSQSKLCVFEYIYFMSPKSFIDSKYIYEIREVLGRLLAKKENLDKTDYIVVGVPETGISSAQSYARYLDIEYQQIIKKKDKTTNGSDRTFILPDNKKRIEACDKKFVFDSKSIKNKKIILIDDTIVRGNVIKSIIKKLKLLGATEIHIRIPSPPIINKCQLGIAIKSKDELLMHNKTIEQAKKELEIDSLTYLNLEELNTVITGDNYQEYFLEKDMKFQIL
jgi:amidophosphoribosyltransferase